MDEAEKNAGRAFKNARGKDSGERKAAAEQKARQEVLNRYLQLGPVASEKGRFADPASRSRR